MINLAHTCVFVTAALYVSVASASAARPVDMDKFLDRWSALDIDRCGNGEDSEEAPLQITKDKGGTSIGNYGWMCIIKSWREKAGFVVGRGSCGSEGDDDPHAATFKLKLTKNDDLVLVKDGVIETHRRCEKVKHQ